jgi:hypothetical protein
MLDHYSSDGFDDNLFLTISIQTVSSVDGLQKREVGDRRSGLLDPFLNYYCVLVE